MTADQGTDADSFRQPGHTRLEAADAAHDQSTPGAGLRRSVQRVDHFWIDKVVDFDHDSPFRLQSLVLDQLEHPGSKRRRSDEELAVFALAAVASEVVEELGDVCSHVWITCGER